MEVEFFYPPIISFKSSLEFFRKEQSGAKPNTVRTLNGEEIRNWAFTVHEGVLYSRGKAVERIQIVNAEGYGSFTRTLTDVSLYDGKIIFSWDPAEAHK